MAQIDTVASFSHLREFDLRGQEEQGRAGVERRHSCGCFQTPAKQPFLEMRLRRWVSRATGMSPLRVGAGMEVLQDFLPNWRGLFYECGPPFIS